jgi:toxin ParE1/3/4
MAAGEFDEAQAAGLGLDVVTDVRPPARTVAAQPEIGHRVSKRLRRRLGHRFPYGLLDCGEASAIVIMAVMHRRRQPGSWKGRV